MAALVLDQTAGDPKWIIATVTDPGDVKPALIGPGGVFAALADAGRWVAARLGRARPRLVPLHRPAVWRLDE